MDYLQPLTAIYLYDNPDAAGLDIDEVGGYLAAQFPTVEVLPRSDFLTHQFVRFSAEQRAELEPEVMRQLARARAAEFGGAQPDDVAVGWPPEDLHPDLTFEAAALQTVLRLLIDPAEAGADRLHITFTDYAIGSWRGARELFCLHIIALGEPSVISTTGLVEALPRPREYQFKRAQFAMLGVDEEALEDLAEEFAHCTFGYADPRINEVCKGYALMACFYRMFGEAFCADPTCRLYAARNQAELIRTQCSEHVGLCGRHEAMRRSLPHTPAEP